MRRLAAALLLAALAACASPPPSEEVNRLRASAQRATVELKQAGALLEALAYEAHKLPDEKVAARLVAMQRVKTAQLATEVLDEVERTYELALRFQDYRAQLGGSAHPADGAVARMTEATAALEARAVSALREHAGGRETPPRTSDFQLDQTLVRSRIEEDREVLKALRTAVGIATRIPDLEPAPDPATPPAR